MNNITLNFHMKITFIEDHKGRPSRFEYLKHSIRKSGHEVQETSTTSPFQKQLTS